MPFDDVSEISLSQIEVPIFFKFVQNGYDLITLLQLQLEFGQALCPSF
jgi:hypothetical protein